MDMAAGTVVPKRPRAVVGEHHAIPSWIGHVDELPAAANERGDAETKQPVLLRTARLVESCLRVFLFHNTLVEGVRVAGPVMTLLKSATRLLAAARGHPLTRDATAHRAHEKCDAGVDGSLLRSLLGLTRSTKGSSFSTTLTPHLFSSFA